MQINHEKRWAEQAGIKIAGRNINNFRYADDIRKSRKILLMKMKEKSEKAGLKRR